MYWYMLLNSLAALLKQSERANILRVRMSKLACVCMRACGTSVCQMGKQYTIRLFGGKSAIGCMHEPTLDASTCGYSLIRIR